MSRFGSAARLGLLSALGLALLGCDRSDRKQEGNAAAAKTTAGSASTAGVTPMAERVAVLGVLNKRNGIVRDVAMRPGQSGRWKDLIVRLRACEKTAPWETVQDTGAFVQLDVQQPDQSWRRVFSGWLYKDRPAENVVQHPIYDVWPKSCAMTFRETGPDTVPAGEAGAKGSSSAKKSPETEGAPVASPAPDSPSAAPSNAT